MTTAARTAEQRKPAAPGKNAPGLSSTPRPRRVAKAPPKGLATTPAKTIDAAALQEAFLKPRRTVLTRDVFLRSQGPKVVEIELPNMGAFALMRRIDLLELARRGGDHWPLRGAVLRMIQKGGIQAEMTDGEALAETLDIAAAVALATIVVPPPEYVAAASAEYGTEQEATAARDAALAAVREADLRPFFVPEGQEPDDDQAVLRWFSPDAEDEGDGDVSGASIDDFGWVHWADLIVILRMAHRFGPGALGRRFRGDEPEADAMAALLALAGAGGAAA